MVSWTRLRARLARLPRDRRGGTAVTFGLLAAGLLGASGLAIDYANLANCRSDLQRIADTAALSAAREFRLGNADATTIGRVATAYARGALDQHGLTAEITPTVDTTAKTVTVRLVGTVATYMIHLADDTSAHASVQATAKVVGGAPICVIGLNTNQQQTVHLSQSAKLKAPGCSVYSDSSNGKGLYIQDDATLDAAFICSSGGKEKLGAGTFNPTPQTDCPVIPDPLAARPEPPVPSTCSRTNYVISFGTAILKPGLYCGGLTVKGTAHVRLEPGVYVIKDGDFLVTDFASFTGTNVGFYLTGSDPRLRFERAATVSLTAPKTGPLAGILVFEDRSVSHIVKHEISADNANTLLGTFYIPRGQLDISANRPVADKSAYTIVVADRFTLAAGPTMVLNTDYNSTDVPVPEGVGPNGTKTFLTQ